MNSSDILVSVIICTHRRPDSLALALKSLEDDNNTQHNWEVLVVENDVEATKDVADVIEKFKPRLPIRWCLEPIPNLSRARNRGASEARGVYLAYIDDDCEVLPGWVSALLNDFQQYSPDFAGGPIYPLYRSPKPYWYKDEWEIRAYHGDKPKKVDSYFSGGNFLVKRDLAIKLGGFNEGLGMAGGKIAYGEETDLMIRAKEINPKLNTMYFPNAAVKHEVRANKMAIRWCIQSSWATGRDCITIGMGMEWLDSWPKILKSFLRANFLILSKIPYLSLIATADTFRPGRSIWRRYFKEHILNSVRDISCILRAAELRIKHNN